MNEKIINEWDEEHDSIIYSCKSYSSGAISRVRKDGYENAITNTAQRQLELETNIQYLVDLAEINMEE